MTTQTQMILTNAVWNDAGLMRAYLATRTGRVLVVGGSLEAMRTAGRHARHLAKIAGLTFEQVVANLQADISKLDA